MAPPPTRSLRPCLLPWPQCRATSRGTRSTKLRSSWNNFRNRLVFIRIFLLFRWWRERDGRDGACFEAQLDDGGVCHGGCGVTLQQRNTTGGGKALTGIPIFTARGVDSCLRDFAVRECCYRSETFCGNYVKGEGLLVSNSPRQPQCSLIK